MKKFHGISYLPDGSIYEQGSWNVEDLLENCPAGMAEKLLLDSKRRKNSISSPIGELDFVWTGSPVMGASTLLRKGIMINAGLYFPGVDAKEESEMLNFFISQWREFSVVKELQPRDHGKIFHEVAKFKERPLACTVNWATISKDEYDQIAYYDLFIGACYFQAWSDLIRFEIK
jgi:hypothetical protein